MDDRRSRLLIGAVVLTVYMTSLCLPVARSGDMAYGYTVLMIGWFGILMLQFGWFGNVLFWILLPSMTFFSRPIVWISRTVAVLLALCTADALAWRNIPTDASDGPITEYGACYYLWIVCMVALVFWTFFRTSRRAPDTTASNFS